MSNKTEDKTTLHIHLVSQWITSLAISVVCCSVLFVVFAGYIVQLHEVTNLLTVRLEMMQNRQVQLENDMAVLRRTPVINLHTSSTDAEKNIFQSPVKVSSENGVELVEPSSINLMDKDDLSISATGDVSLPNEAMNPVSEIPEMIEETATGKE